MGTETGLGGMKGGVLSCLKADAGPFLSMVWFSLCVSSESGVVTNSSVWMCDSIQGYSAHSALASPARSLVHRVWSTCASCRGVE